MSLPRPHFAVDATRHWEWSDVKPGVTENLSFWHIAAVYQIRPSPATLERTNRGIGTLTIIAVYERLDVATRKLWILEYKCVAGQNEGITKTMRWMPEEEVAEYEKREWHPLTIGERADPGASLNSIRPMHQVQDDGVSLDVEKMKAVLRGFEWDTNTDAVGAVIMEHLHDFAALNPA